MLNIILRDQTLDDERLSTLFGEAESIVNGRPLTVSTDDPNDESPLRGPDLPPVSLIRVMSTEGVGDMFSFSLTSSGNAGYVRLAPERNLQIRDVVLIMGENTPGRTGRWGV